MDMVNLRIGYQGRELYNAAIRERCDAYRMQGLSGMVSVGKSREPRISTYSREAAVMSVKLLRLMFAGRIDVR